MNVLFCHTWHASRCMCVSLQSSLCVFPSSFSWGCCHKSTHLLCTSSSSWTSMCSGATVSDLYMHSSSAGVMVTSTEWDHRHSSRIYYDMTGSAKMLICIPSGPVPVRLSWPRCWHPLCALCSLHKPFVSTVQRPAQHCHSRSALWLLLRSP